MPERKTWRRAYSRRSHKEFLTEEAFKATIIKDFFTGSKTYTAFYYSSHDEDCMIITALLLAE